MMRQQENRQLNAILRRIMFRVVALRFSAGLMSLLAASGWIFLCVAAWTAVAGEPSLWQTLAVSRAVLGLFFACAVFMIVLPLARTPGPKRLAGEIEHRKDFKDLLVAAYEFSRDEEAARKYNPALIREVIRRAVEELSPLRARFLFLQGTQMALAPLAYGGLLCILVLSLSRPALVLETGKRIIHPRAAAAPLPEANILASPCGITVLAGADVEVSGLDFGGTERPVEIHFSGMGEFWKSEPAKRDSVRFEGAVLPRYSYEFRGLRNSLSYFFQSGETRTANCRITVVHKPIVRDIIIVRTPPRYTGERPDTLVDSGGNVHALEGTRIAIAGTSNNILASVAVRFDEARDVHASPPRPAFFAGRDFKFEFTAARDEFYTILLEDTAGYRNDDPLVYTVETYKDNPPTLDLLEPGGDASLPRNQLLGVSFIAGDDYGVAEAAIFHRTGSDGPFVKEEIDCAEQAGRKEIAKSFVWDLRDISLFPGNTVEYYLQVSDNNVVTGPGVAVSGVFRITVPTMEELYSEIAEGDSQRSDLLAESLREGEEFKNRIEKLSREFKKTQNLDWSQKKEADKAVLAQQEIQSKLEEVKSSLDATLQDLSDNRMTSEAIGEKMEEIRKLLDEINDEALNKYIEDLQQAISALNPEEIQSALQNLSMSAEDLLKKLERTASLLEAVRREQRMEELVRKSRGLAEKQKDLLDETAETASDDKARMADLAKRQEELAKEAAGMKEGVDELRRSLDEGEIASRLEASSKRISQNAVADKMSTASRYLKQAAKDQAMEQQEQALEELISLFTSLNSCQASMEQTTQQKQAVYLQKYAKETLDVSFKQEELLDDIGGAAGGAGDARASKALAEKQLSCLKAAETIADDVFDIAKQTMAVSPALLHYLGESLKAMNSVLFNLDQNRALYAMPQASMALEALNRAAIEMLRAAKSCSSGAGCSMGMKDLMQQLLSGQQEILQQSKEMMAMQLLQEQLRMEQQAKMQRLASAQRSLKEIAEEIAKQSQEDKGTLGRMDKILEDMEAVIKDLENSALGKRTLDHQERILSRLLDAQRSIHTRDYERKRRSVTAGDVYSRGFGGTETENSVRELREAIRKAMQLKAPGEFEDLIKFYFRALAEEHPAAAPAEEQR